MFIVATCLILRGTETGERASLQLLHLVAGASRRLLQTPSESSTSRFHACRVCLCYCICSNSQVVLHSLLLAHAKEVTGFLPTST